MSGAFTISANKLDRSFGAVVPGFCHVCGGAQFAHTDVLSEELVSAWGLSTSETRYVNIQQGTHCLSCNSNVRSIALARAILGWRGYKGALKEFVEGPDQDTLRVLEINEAGTLHPFLSRLRNHKLASYPEFDMMRLALPSASVDLVVHSDTLEHVAEPKAALNECYRLLDIGGALIFTVPIILGRLTRNRKGMPPSFHGAPGCTDPGMRVQTEFGADAWAMVLGAGFSSCEMVPYLFPSGLALVARRGDGGSK